MISSRMIAIACFAGWPLVFRLSSSIGDVELLRWTLGLFVFQIGIFGALVAVGWLS